MAPEYYIIPFIGPGQLDYPGEAPREIGRLMVRIAPNTRVVETVVQPGRVSLIESGLATIAESGGAPLTHDLAPFSPATEVEGAVITVAGPGFLRGDSNTDGRVDLSDAVATLRFLFSGGADPGCMDAADADDSGKLEITDPIFLLGVLFLGKGALPEPHPACGADKTSDDLGCEVGC